eukprot:1325300-Amorphochlora_amoeboformis.AAC.1
MEATFVREKAEIGALLSAQSFSEEGKAEHRLISIVSNSDMSIRVVKLLGKQREVQDITAKKTEKILQRYLGLYSVIVQSEPIHDP